MSAIERRDAEAVELIAGLEFPRRWQPAPLPGCILEPLRGEAFHADHERGGVVAATRGKSGMDHRFARRLRRSRSEERGELGSLHPVVDTVARQQEDVANLQLALLVVDVHALVEADRTRQLCAEIEIAASMIARELRQLSASQQPGARVTDVRESPAVTLESKRRQRGRTMAAAGAAVVIG